MILRWLIGEENANRFGEWLLRSPFGPSLRAIIGWLSRRLEGRPDWQVYGLAVLFMLAVVAVAFGLTAAADALEETL